MTTAWSHLPNAAHIDRILADVSINSESWHAAWLAAKDAASDAAWNAAWNAARDEAWDAARVAARIAARDAARYAARDAAKREDINTSWLTARSAILALIAWDESSEYLNLSGEQVRVLSLLGDKKAMLLLPAVLAVERSKELV